MGILKGLTYHTEQYMCAQIKHLMHGLFKQITYLTKGRLQFIEVPDLHRVDGYNGYSDRIFALAKLLGVDLENY